MANQAAVLHSFFIPKRRVAGCTFADEICVAENTASGKFAFDGTQLAGAEHGSIPEGERSQNGCRGNQSPDDAASTQTTQRFVLHAFNPNRRSTRQGGVVQRGSDVHECSHEQRYPQRNVNAVP